MKTCSYFPHDSNAKDDPKCMVLIDQLGLEGYGIFWVLIETLREQPDFSYPLSHTSILAKRYNTSKEKIDTVIRNYQLFSIRDDLFFFSESLANRMGEIAQKKLRQSEGGKKGMLSRWRKNQLQLTSCEEVDNLVISNLKNENNLLITSKVKESKVKQSKENKIIKIKSIGKIQKTPREKKIELLERLKEDEYVSKIQALLKAEFIQVSTRTLVEKAELFIQERIVSDDLGKDFPDYANHFLNRLRSEHRKKSQHNIEGDAIDYKEKYKVL